MLKSFVIVILGGMGSVPGAVVGALIIGLVESLSSYFITPAISPFFMYIIFVVILLVRPVGLLGKETLH